MMLCLLLAALLSGCGAKERDTAAEDISISEQIRQEQEESKETEAEQASEKAVDVKMPDAGILIGKSSIWQWKDTENRTLLTAKVNNISVGLCENQEMEKNLAAFFQEREAAFLDTLKIYRELSAQALMEADGTEETTEFRPYYLEKNYTAVYTGERIISIVEDMVVDTGDGAPETVRTAYNFDAADGRRLVLSDVITNQEAFLQECDSYLSQEITHSPAADGLYADYASRLSNVLTDSTWYQKEADFYVICNPGLVAPASVGILEFMLPFAADFMDGQSE